MSAALEQAFYDKAFGPAAAPMRSVYRRWESNRGLSDNALAATYQDLAEATRLTEGQPAYRKRVNRIKMYAHFLKIYLQPKAHGSHEDDVKAWVKQFGEAEAKRRVDALGDWVARISPVNLVHGQAFNKYFKRRGELLGIDVSQWGKEGVPTEAEIESIFARDLADLKDVKVKPVPAAVYSHHLAPLSSAKANIPGMKGREAGSTGAMRSGQLLLKLNANESATLTFADKGAPYATSFLATADFESGMGPRFATPLTEGTAEGKTLTVKADKAGYYFVRFTGGRPNLTQVDRPYALLQGSLQLQQARLYFFVPKGTRHFILEASAYKGATVKLLDPAGKVAVEQGGFAVHRNDVDLSKLQTRWVVDVPAGMDGAVWCVQGPGDLNVTSRPNLIGVPPYYALDPAQLLVPKETLPGERTDQ